MDATPLVTLLDKAVSAGGMVVRDGNVYTGFASYHDLASSCCTFAPMNSNRAVNQDVVRQRVNENITCFEQHNSYLDFGQIVLMIVAEHHGHEFLVMDGQHRCETMKELHRLFPHRHIRFQFRAKVVASELQAHAELLHFQRSYPTDYRSFFPTRAASRIGTSVLGKLKAKHPAAFKEMVLFNRHGHGTADPPRPYVNDNIVFWLLQDSGLVGGAADIGREDGIDEAHVLSMLNSANQYLSMRKKEGLGKNVTDRMMKLARETELWLGFFREGNLVWRDVKEHLLIESPTTDSAGTPSAPATRDCVLCMEKASVVAFVPCGHCCVCEVCAATVCAMKSALCPLCRGNVETSHRIYF